MNFQKLRSPSIAPLVGALGFTLTILVAEVVAGLWSNSLALLSDAAHMLSDSAGLIIALVAALIGSKRATPFATYGYKRVEVLAALVNATTVGVVAVWIVIEAVQRIREPQEINTPIMLLVAVIGLIANAISAKILHGNHSHDAHTHSSHSHDRHKQDDQPQTGGGQPAKNQAPTNLNVRAAYLHVLSDLLGSVAVIIAALVIHFTGFRAADTIASIAIAVLILPRSWALLAESAKVLLEHTPKQIDPVAVREALLAIPDVKDVHDLHIWTVDGSEALATCHLVTDQSLANSCPILDRAGEILSTFGISHSTIQVEGLKHLSHQHGACH